MKKTVLITGAAGFLGSHLCYKFIAKGYKVIAMDNLITGDKRNIEHLFKLEDFDFYHHDVTKFVHVAGEIDYILHFASPACLLYTSPSPRDRTRSRMPSSA